MNTNRESQNEISNTHPLEEQQYTWDEDRWEMFETRLTRMWAGEGTWQRSSGNKKWKSSWYTYCSKEHQLPENKNTIFNLPPCDQTSLLLGFLINSPSKLIQWNVKDTNLAQRQRQERVTASRLWSPPTEIWWYAMNFLHRLDSQRGRLWTRMIGRWLSILVENSPQQINRITEDWKGRKLI